MFLTILLSFQNEENDLLIHFFINTVFHQVCRRIWLYQRGKREWGVYKCVKQSFQYKVIVSQSL